MDLRGVTHFLHWILMIDNPQSYQLNHVLGSTSRAPNRDMSMEGNFQWDADGRKRSEIREDYSGADSVPNVNEYTMIQGRSSIVGRVRPDSLSEWYVKDYVPPAEQYTGKEWDGTYEFYYFGARFLDPVLGMWVVPDPAGQFANPYGFGGDPVNYTDPDGRFVHLIVGAVNGAGVGAYQAYKNDASFWEAVGYIGGGAAIGTAVAATGGAVGGAVIAGGGGTVGAGMSAGFVGGAMSGGLNYSLNAGIQGGFSANGLAQSIAIGGISGMVGGGVGSMVGPGLLGSASAGFAGGITGGYLNGARGTDLFIAGAVGMGLSSGAYSLQVGAYAAQDYFSTLHESGFTKSGLADLYQKQNEAARGPMGNKTEFGLIDDANSAVELKYDIMKDVNNWPEGGSADSRIIHSHGPGQEMRVPSPGDYRAAGVVNAHNVKTYMMDTPTRMIYQYDNSGIVRSYDYNPNPSYGYYVNKYFQF